MTKRLTISVPDELADDIHAELSYGDNRSEWVRDAIREKLARDAVDGADKPDVAIESAPADSNEVG